MRSRARPTLSEARAKAEKYCAYQERSHREVENKLFDLGLTSSEIQDVLLHLIQSDFLNEERFAVAFARGKFKVKGWGRNKIIYHLKAKGINEQLIRHALEQIESDDYINTLKKLIAKKDQMLKETDVYMKMSKVTQFLRQRGFETETAISEVRKFYGL